MVLYTPTTLERGLRTIFMTQLAMEPANLIDKLATVVKSNSDKESYQWLGQAPQVEEIIDEFKVSGVLDTDYEIVNKKYGSMLEISKDDISDDLTGGIQMLTRQMAVVAARHPNKLLIAALTSGTTVLGYDANAYFSATHPARGKSGTQSNLVTQTGTTTDAIAADLNSAIGKLLGFLGENGEPMSDVVTPKMIVVAPLALRKPFKETLLAPIISNSSNVAFQDDSIELLVTPRLTGTAWYLLAVDGPIRPLVWQDREPIEFLALEDNSGSDQVFRREQYLYKSRYRGAAGYGPWQKAVKVA